MAVNLMKTMDGSEVQVPTTGKANAALTTGIIGTSLAGLLALGGTNGGLFGGGGIGNGVDKDLFYQTQINSINVANSQLADVNAKICDLQSQIAIANTANTYQNTIRDMGFAAVDQRFRDTMRIVDYEIGARTCKFVEGNVFLSPRNLADNYISPTRVLDSHEPRYLDEQRHRFGYDWGWDGGCAPCGR